MEQVEQAPAAPESDSFLSYNGNSLSVSIINEILGFAKQYD